MYGNPCTSSTDNEPLSYFPVVNTTDDLMPLVADSHSEQQSSDDTNSPYPTTAEAFKEDSTAACATNNRPLHHSSYCGGSPYPPIAQAFRDDANSPSTDGRQSEEQSSSSIN